MKVTAILAIGCKLLCAWVVLWKLIWKYGVKNIFHQVLAPDPSDKALQKSLKSSIVETLAFIKWNPPTARFLA